MLYSSCLRFLGILEQWHAWFRDCSSQREASSAVRRYRTNARAFYLLCRVQRPHQTHKHLVSKCTRIPMSSLLLLHLSCKQNDKICMFGRYPFVATGWFRKKRVHCQSEAKRGSGEMCLVKGPSCVLGWRQGSKGRRALSPSTPWLLFTRWESVQSFMKDIWEKMKHFPGLFSSPSMRETITSVTWHSGAVAVVGIPMSHRPLHPTELCC